jgi:uncharacterized protein
MPAAPKFEIYKDKKNEFRFRLKAGNGEVIAVGESYPKKTSVLKGIASIQKNAPAAEIIDTTIVKAEEKKPAAKKTAAKKPRTSGPAAKKPAAKKAAAKKPAAAKIVPENKPAE